MSFQYPPPSGGGSDMDMQQSSYIPVYPVPSQQQPPVGVADPRTSQLSMHGAREPSLGLRRSFSTPNAIPYPASGIDQAPGGLMGEGKKRNKLGYHRSSVACVHCRKRKIRCVADVNDKQGRCTNCMRLKKDCSFHPVDQPPQTEARPKSSIRGADGPKAPSASASPATSSGQPAEIPSKRPLSRQIIPPGVAQIGVGQDEDARTSISDTPSNGRVAGPAFELSSHGPVPWGMADLDTSLQNKTADFANQWQPSSTTMNEQFPSYDGLPVSPGWHDTPNHQAHEGMPWPGTSVPARSMSYSGEGMPGHPHGQFPNAQHDMMYDRRPSQFTSFQGALDGPVPNVDPGGHHIHPSGGPADSTAWESHQEQAQMQVAYPQAEGFDGWTYGAGGSGR